MIRSFILKQVAAKEKEFGVPLDYLRHMVRTSVAVKITPASRLIATIGEEPETVYGCLDDRSFPQIRGDKADAELIVGFKVGQVGQEEFFVDPPSVNLRARRPDYFKSDPTVTIAVGDLNQEEVFERCLALGV